jgi:phage terminase Nu1 subunit (DNA packaging protein)
MEPIIKQLVEYEAVVSNALSRSSDLIKQTLKSVPKSAKLLKKSTELVAKSIDLLKKSNLVFIVNLFPTLSAAELIRSLAL